MAFDVHTVPNVHLKVQTICVLQCIYCMPYASRGRILSDLGAESWWIDWISQSLVLKLQSPWESIQPRITCMKLSAIQYFPLSYTFNLAIALPQLKMSLPTIRGLNNKSKYHGKAAGAVPSSGAAQRNKRKEAAIAKGHGTQSDFAAT